MTKRSRYVKTFKVKDEDKDKNNKLMSFRIDHENLLQKYKTIWTKIEDLKHIELNALPVYDERCKKTKIGTNGDKVCTNFRGLNVPEDDVECESFTVISIDSLLVYENKYYLQVCLVLIKLQTNKWQIILMTIFLKIRYCRCCIMIDLT